MNMVPGNKRPTRSIVTDPTTKTVTSGAGKVVVEVKMSDRPKFTTIDSDCHGNKI